MAAATEGMKRGDVRGVGALRDRRTGMTSGFFVIYGIYGADCGESANESASY